MIGVPGALYLQAFSSRLSTIWASNGGWIRTTEGESSATFASKSAARGVIRPSAEVVGHPLGEVHDFGLGPARFGLGQQEQRLDDLPQAGPFVADPLKDPPVLLGGTISAERHLDLSEQGGQRRAELVRGVAGEPLLPVVCLVHVQERRVQPVEEVIEGPAQLVELVAGAG